MWEIGIKTYETHQYIYANHGTAIVKNHLTIVPISHRIVVRPKFIGTGIYSRQHPKKVVGFCEGCIVNNQGIVVIFKDIGVWSIRIKAGINPI